VNRITVTRTAHEGASPAGNDERAKTRLRVTSRQASVETFSRSHAIPSSEDGLRGWCGVESVCLEQVLGIHQTLRDKWAHPGHLLGQPAPRPIFLSRMNWGGVGRSVGFDDAAASDYMGHTLSLSGAGHVGDDLGASKRLKLSPWSRCTAANFASFQSLQPRQFAVRLPPHLQHSSCCFGVTQFPDLRASSQATHLGAQPQPYWSSTGLHLHWQTAKMGQRIQFRNMSASAIDTMMWCHGTFHLVVLIQSLRLQLH
jgi:hypothetical protein